MEELVFHLHNLSVRLLFCSNARGLGLMSGNLYGFTHSKRLMMQSKILYPLLITLLMTI